MLSLITRRIEWGQLTLKRPMRKCHGYRTIAPSKIGLTTSCTMAEPSLAAHGGEVSLIEVTEDQFAVLQFVAAVRAVVRWI